MKECVLCKTRYQKGSGVTFHKFPTDKRRLELWLKNIEKPSLRPKKYDYIYSKHFADDCFIKHNSCTTLKKCSIPTIFCNSVEHASSTHESMVLPTPSVSGTKMVTPAPPVPETIAVEVKRRLIMEQNDTNLSCRRRQSPKPSFPAVLTARVLKDLIHKTQTLFPDLQNYFEDTLVSDNFNSHFHIFIETNNQQIYRHPSVRSR